MGGAYSDCGVGAGVGDLSAAGAGFDAAGGAERAGEGAGRRPERIVGGSGATNLDLLRLNLKPHVVYRITALAQGLKPNSRVVLQQTYARQITKD